MPLAAIALGSNLGGAAGSREANLHGAVQALQTLGNVLAVSDWIETAPVGYLDQPAFLNGAVVLQTSLAPAELLHELLHIEQQYGRDRSHGIAKGPRTLDLDVLLYDDAIVRTEALTVPHPALAERAFVLAPLAQIAPQWKHPQTGKTVAEMLQSVS